MKYQNILNKLKLPEDRQRKNGMSFSKNIKANIL